VTIKAHSFFIRNSRRKVTAGGVSMFVVAGCLSVGY